MAIIDLSATNEYPAVSTTASVGTTQQEITLPDTARTVSAGGNAAIWLVLDSVADGAAVPTNKISIPADQILEVQLPQGKNQRIEKIAVAAQSGTATISVILEA